MDSCRRQTLEVFWTDFHALLRESGLRMLRSMSQSVASCEEFRKHTFLGVDFRTYLRHMLGRPQVQVEASVHGDSGKKFPHFLRGGDPGSRGRHSSCAMSGSPADTCSTSVWVLLNYFRHFLHEGGYRILKSFCPALLCAQQMLQLPVLSPGSPSLTFQ